VSKQKIPLRHRQHLGGRAGEQFAIGGDTREADGETQRAIADMLSWSLASAQAQCCGNSLDLTRARSGPLPSYANGWE
jgi:hypothetical protein